MSGALLAVASIISTLAALGVAVQFARRAESAPPGRLVILAAAQVALLAIGAALAAAAR